MPSDHSLYTLSQPQKLADALAASEKDSSSQTDCLSCRLVGASALIGLGAYTYHSGTTQLATRRAAERLRASGSRFGMGARRKGVMGLSAGLVAMGVYRLVN
ncbi:MAG: hypothetical protein Q9219_004216 [cf. Caloplaca sp. 3 TL-2023]